MDTSIFCTWLFWFAIAALLGFLLAWLLRGSKLNWWKSEYEGQKNAFGKLEGEHNSLLKKESKWNSEKKDLLSEKSKLNTNYSNLNLKVNGFESSIAALTSEKSGLNDRLGILRKDTTTLQGTIADRDATIIELTKKNQNLNQNHESEMSKLRAALEATRKEKEGMMPKMNEYKDKYEDANLERNTLKARYDATLAKVGGYTEQISLHKSEANQAIADLQALKNELEAANQKYTNLTAEIEKERGNTANADAKFAELDASRNDLQLKYNSLLRLQEENESKAKQGDSEKAALNTKIADLEAFKLKWQSLSNEKPQWIAKQSELNTEIEQLKTKLSQSEGNSGQKIAQLNGQLSEYQAYKAKWEALNNEKPTWISKQAELNTEIEQLKARATQSEGDSQKMVQLNNQLSEYQAYKAKWEVLNTEKPNWTAKDREQQAEIERLKALLNRNNGKDQQIVQLNGQLAEYRGFQNKWISLSNEKTQWTQQNGLLNDENARLKAELEALRQKAVATPAPAPAAPKKLSKADKEAKADQAKANLTAAMGTKIAKATAADKDDLQRINGVGPFIEKKLNALGIYTFEQVSQFDTDLVQVVTDAIQFFPGRITRDNWVGQSGELFKEKKNS